MAAAALALAATLALLIGIVLGTLGGGGAILTLPMLVYAVGVPAKSAIAMSLFVVGATSLVGAAMHARARRVRWRIGGLFGAAAMAGAFLGGNLARLVPAPILLVLFGGVMVMTATVMLRGADAPREPKSLPMAGVLGLGAVVGVVSGLVGAGGGFLIVPALTLFGGLAMRDAIGTSLFIITLQSFAGFAGHASHTDLDAPLLGAVTAAATVGAIGGARLSAKVSPASLRRAFAWLVIAMAILVFVKELPLAAALGAAAATMLLAAVAARRSGSSFTGGAAPPQPRACADPTR
jgi:hypothetical protein